MSPAPTPLIPAPRPWDADELAWLRECVAAGDTLEEIAAWSRRSLDDVTAKAASLAQGVAARDLRLAALYADPERTVAGIAAELGVSLVRVRQLLNRLRAKGFAIPRREGARASFVAGNTVRGGRARRAAA